MRKINKVYCFFEQSGAFKDAFIKFGIHAEDFDIENNYGKTDHIRDLFHDIDSYPDRGSIFHEIKPDDLIIAFFPCIYFSDAKTLFFRGTASNFNNSTQSDIISYQYKQLKLRTEYHIRLLRLVDICLAKNIPLIIENPWSISKSGYLQYNFFPPTLIDNNRSIRGDLFIKPTAYWFFNISPTEGSSYKPCTPLTLNKQPSSKAGSCSMPRSVISPDYAINFISDFILGVQSPVCNQLSLDL